MMKLDDFRSGTPAVKTLCYWLAALMAQPWILAGSAWGAYSDETAARLPVASNDSYNFAVADVDGANGPDLLVANRGQSRLLISDGSGNFIDETETRLPAALHTTLAVAFADIDGANGPDAILVGDGQNKIYMNDGSGNFSDETGARMPTGQRVSIDVAVGDVDGDSDPDLVIANRRSSNRVLINNGAGVFTDESAARLPPDMDLSYGVALGDADNSGSVDIFFANFAGQNRLLINNNLGAFADESGSRLPAATNTTGGATFIDVDGDGDQDIATAEGGNGVGILLNNSGIFTDAAGGSVPVFSEFAIRAKAGDINFDGSEDLLIATMGQDRLFINNGSGVFSDATGTDLPADDRRSFGARLFDADADFDLDAVLGTPQGQNRFLENQMAGPRILIDISPDYIEVTDTVSIDLTVFDETGVDTTVLEVIEPSATINIIPIVGDSGSFTPDEIGVHTVRVTASDISANVSIKEAQFNAQPADVTDPLISLTVDPLSLTQGESADFVVTATDDRAIATLTLTVGGVNVPLDTLGRASYAPTTVGALPVIATATDARGNSAVDTATLEVLPDTSAPSVTLTATPDPIDITNPISVSAIATDNIAVTALSVVVNGPSGVDVDTPVILDGAGNGSYTPYIPGTYTFTAAASDAGGNTAIDEVTVEAIGIPDAEAPVVSLSVVPGTTVPGGLVRITVNATDNIFVLTRTLTVNGLPLPLDASNQAEFIAPVLGSYTAVATATDPTGNTGSDTVVFDAVDPATDVDPPVVAITSPAEGDDISGIADIVGTATDLTLVGYELSYRPVGIGGFLPLATGSEVVENDVLGSLDTTIVENGLYELQLSATDINGLTSSVTQVVSVEGEYKPGIFTITYEDLNIPLSGIAISLLRTYDSRRRGVSGDFGNGWNLEVVQDATYTNNRELGVGWTGLSGGLFGGLPCQGGVREDLLHITEVRFSDIEFYKFAFQVELTGAFSTLGCEVASLGFAQVGGVPGAALDTLTPYDFVNVQGGNLIDFDTFEIYDAQDVRLTTIDGRVYDLNLTDGLQRIGDLNGNSIFINPTGVVHSNGTSIGFVRDGAGRITRVTDPSGRALDYTYDGAGNLVTSADRVGNTTTYTYIAENYLSEITDPLGNTPMRNEYDDSGRLIAQIDALGSRTEFAHDLDTREQTVTDRDGTVSVLQYDEGGNLDSATIGSITSTYTHDANGNKLTETDPNGNTTTFTYDALDRMTSQTDALGHASTYTYDGDNLGTLTDPQGNALAMTYDGSGNLTAQRDAGGTLLQGFAYDGSGNITQLTLAAGATNMVYDSSGNVTSVTSPSGKLQLFTYDANGKILTASVDRTVAGSVVRETTTNTYDANGNLLTRTDPAGNVTTYTYDANQRKSSMTDALGQRTDYAYDSRGNLERVDHPDGTFEVYGYDLSNRRTAHTDRGGRTTFFEFDSNERLTRTIYPDGSSLTNVYNDGGNLLSETNGLGNTTSYTYDAINRMLTKTDATGAVTTFTYTGDQINPTTETDALGRVTSYVYEDDMLLTEYLVQTSLPGGDIEEQTWGPNSRIATRTDALGRVTTYTYDSAGNLTRVTDALGNATDYTYDEVGNRLTQLDAAGRITTFTYDHSSRMLSKTLPGGAVESWAYDAVGNKLSHTSFSGEVTNYSYDAMGRRVLTTFPGGATEAYTYTNGGRLETVTRGASVTTFGYDARDRIASVASPDGVTLTYSYDSAGNRTTRAGIGATTFSYDAANRLTSVTDPSAQVTSYTYDAIGNIIGISYPNGTNAELAYNVKNQTVEVTHLAPDGSTVLASYVYDLDSVGNRIGVLDHTGAEIDYSYDALNRLVTVIEDPVGTPQVTDYSYDSVGNLLTIAAPSGTDTYTYDVNDRILTAAGRSFAYDVKGNLLQIDEDGDAGTDTDITSFVYDSLNRLTQRTEADGTVTEFEYDFQGNRVARSVGGVRTSFINDNNDTSGLSRVLQERDPGGAIDATYTYGHALLAMDRGGSDSIFHTDALGSVRALSSPAGALTDTYSYDAYGNIVLNTGTTNNEYRFAGGRQDPSTGLYHLGARYFDPEVARFITRDPFPGLAAQPATLHPYQYALNNPVNVIDPNGEFGMVSISISISIVSTLSSIAFSSYKTGKSVEDKLTDLLVTIPGLKLNEEADRDGLGFVDTLAEAAEVEELTDIIQLGGGAVEKSYDVVYGMSSTFGKVVSLIHARNSAIWLAQLPEVDGKPGHYLSCGFNSYVQKTFSLSQVTSFAKGGKLKQAANIIAAWLAYFNFLVLVVETVGDSSGTVHPESCPAIPAA
jgi:RHS repeat-associated protein